MQAAREILDRGYGKVPEAGAEPLPPIIEGMGIPDPARHRIHPRDDAR